MKEKATFFYEKLFEEKYNFDSNDEKTNDILKTFYLMLLIKYKLFPGTEYEVSGLYEQKGKVIEQDFLNGIKNDIRSVLNDIDFTLYTNDDNYHKSFKIGYINFERNNYMSITSNSSYMLHAKQKQYDEILEDYGQTTCVENVIISGLNSVSLIKKAIETVKSIENEKFTFSKNNAADYFMTSKKDYIITASDFSLLFAAILVVVSIFLLFFFLISVEKNEEKNLSLVRCFGYDKLKSIVPLATIPLTACFIAFIFSIIFVIIINSFGNSYLGSLFGINASFIFINPLLLLISLGCSLVLSALCLIIPIVKFRKRDLLSLLN